MLETDDIEKGVMLRIRNYDYDFWDSLSKFVVQGLGSVLEQLVEDKEQFRSVLVSVFVEHFAKIHEAVRSAHENGSESVILFFGDSDISVVMLGIDHFVESGKQLLSNLGDEFTGKHFESTANRYRDFINQAVRYDWNTEHFRGLMHEQIQRLIDENP